MAQKPLISIDTGRILAHVALLAAWEGNMAAADQIFDALQAANMKQPNIHLCRAMICAFRGQYRDCMKLLDAALESEPGNMSAKGLRGYVMYILKDPNWRRPLEEVIANNSDPASVRLANKVLQSGDKKFHMSMTLRDGVITPRISYV